MGKAEDQAKLLAKVKARHGGKNRKTTKVQPKKPKGAKFSLTRGLTMGGWDVGGSSNSVSFSRSTGIFKGGKF